MTFSTSAQDIDIQNEDNQPKGIQDKVTEH